MGTGTGMGMGMGTNPLYSLTATELAVLGSRVAEPRARASVGVSARVSVSRSGGDRQSGRSSIEVIAFVKQAAGPTFGRHESI